MEKINFSNFVELVNSNELSDQKDFQRTVRKFTFVDLSVDLGLVPPETLANEQKLKKAVDKNRCFLRNSIFDQYSDMLASFAELEYIERLLGNEKFLFFLAKNSLTNRVIKACKESRLSEALKFRLRQCMGYFILYSLAKSEIFS